MMWIDTYLDEREAKMRIKDALREVEQGRLLRAATGPRKVGGWWKLAAVAFASLLGLVVARLS